MVDEMRDKVGTRLRAKERGKWRGGVEVRENEMGRGRAGVTREVGWGGQGGGSRWARRRGGRGEGAVGGQGEL